MRVYKIKIPNPLQMCSGVTKYFLHSSYEKNLVCRQKIAKQLFAQKFIALLVIVSFLKSKNRQTALTTFNIKS